LKTGLDLKEESSHSETLRRNWYIQGKIKEYFSEQRKFSEENKDFFFKE
jgi:hypothetical protein